MSPLIAATLILFPAFMAYAAASDLLTMRISNRLSLALTASFAVFALLCQLPLIQAGWHVGAGLLVLTVAFGMFAAGWIGGGDAKLAAATALWLGPDLLFTRFAMGWPWLERLHAPRTGVPYGIALAAAALVVFPESPIWKAVIA